MRIMAILCVMLLSSVIMLPAATKALMPVAAYSTSEDAAIYPAYDLPPRAVRKLEPG